MAKATGKRIAMVHFGREKQSMLKMKHPKLSVRFTSTMTLILS